MGAIAKKFVTRSLMLALFLFLGNLTLPVSSSAQNYPQAVALEQKVKESAHVLQQRQRDPAPIQEQAKPKRSVAGEFEMLLVKAKAQHATIGQWQKTHYPEPKRRAREGVHKKRL
jgi:hypothetical protein